MAFFLAAATLPVTCSWVLRTLDAESSGESDSESGFGASLAMVVSAEELSANSERARRLALEPKYPSEGPIAGKLVKIIPLILCFNVADYIILSNGIV